MSEILEEFLITFKSDVRKAAAGNRDLANTLTDVERMADKATKATAKGAKAEKSMAKASNEATAANGRQASSLSTIAKRFLTIAAAAKLAKSVVRTVGEGAATGRLVGSVAGDITAFGTHATAAGRLGGDKKTSMATMAGMRTELAGLKYGDTPGMFKVLGMAGSSAFDANNKVKSVPQIMEDIARHFEGRPLDLKNRAEAAGFDPGLIKLMQLGPDAMKAQLGRSSELGVTTGGQAKAFMELQNKTAEAMQSAGSSFREAIMPLIPALIRFAEGATELTQLIRSMRDAGKLTPDSGTIGRVGGWGVDSLLRGVGLDSWADTVQARAAEDAAKEAARRSNKPFVPRIDGMPMLTPSSAAMRQTLEGSIEAQNKQTSILIDQVTIGAGDGDTQTLANNLKAAARSVTAQYGSSGMLA